MPGQRLWAPWRMRYVQSERKDNGCIFCLAAESSDDEARLVLHRGERCLVMLNAFPYNSGHLVVSPHHHVASIERTSTTTSCSSFMAVTADTRVLPQALEDSYAQLRARFT